MLPGRHKRELQPETIEILNKRFRVALERIKSLEIPELRHTYE